jgi:hypothetical protein
LYQLFVILFEHIPSHPRNYQQTSHSLPTNYQLTKFDFGTVVQNSSKSLTTETAKIEFSLCWEAVTSKQTFWEYCIFEIFSTGCGWRQLEFW